MAGITNSEFVKKLIPYGFDLVTIGGYNIDGPTIAAGEEILKRGRSEFKIAEEEIIDHIEKEVNDIKNDFNVLISANLRSTSVEPIIEVSKIKNLDLIEINCHCRQEEIVNINCGQSMMKNTSYLSNFLKEIVKKSKSKVSVKIRANVKGVDTLELSKIVDSVNADFLHIDAMKPNYNHCDLDIVKEISDNTDISIIGNNSIVDLKSAKDMINAGASGISMARTLIKGNVPFDLNEIKPLF